MSINLKVWRKGHLSSNSICFKKSAYAAENAAHACRFFCNSSFNESSFVVIWSSCRITRKWAACKPRNWQSKCSILRTPSITWKKNLIPLDRGIIVPLFISSRKAKANPRSLFEIWFTKWIEKFSRKLSIVFQQGISSVVVN